MFHRIFCCIFIALLFALVATADSSYQHPLQYQSTMSSALNVFKKPLKLFSTQPMTGFYRDGYCHTGPDDAGNHAVAGIVSDEFLDYSAKQGNNLRAVGLTGGCRWCLCTTRWLQALDAYRNSELGPNGVPRIDLDATEDSVLKKIPLETLQAFAVKTDGVNGK
ncbi:respiratory supercomplex factor 1- mitochondrial [Apiospora arundinis]